MALPEDPVFTPGSRLGRYELLRRLAVGGMAEIYVARVSGPEGFARLVALKLILPQHATSEEAVRMFLDEARLGAMLHHPNVASVYDFGRERGAHYIAMELVHGVDLAEVLEATRRRGMPLPLSAALAVAGAVAAALHHAHERRDAEGRPLGLVHRDVSPSNVLVGFEGSVKLADFGIAKARTDRPPTGPGLVRGKAAYMSPEQCRGLPLDRRSDIYGLGCLLYEMTTGVRLHEGASDFEIFQRAVNEGLPRPSTMVTGYPRALEAIVVRATSRSREERYATAEELGDELEAYARKEGLLPSSAELGRFVRALLPERASMGPQGERLHDDASAPAPAATVAKAAPAVPRRQRWPLAVAVLLAAASAGALAAARRGTSVRTGGCVAGVTVGGEHACAIRSDRSLVCWGRARYGQLGDGRVGQDLISTTAVPVVDGDGRPLAPVDLVDAGRDHTCARRLDGGLWCWGRNDRGQLGDGTRGLPSPRAVPVALVSGVAVVAPAVDHTCARRQDGAVWCWGSHQFGQLGHGAREPVDHPTPQPVQEDASGPSFVFLATGEAHGCGIKADSSVHCWGRNHAGQLGQGIVEQEMNPAPEPVLTSGKAPLDGVTDLGVGRVHTCAVVREGRVFCWGPNGFGQLGNGRHHDQASPVAVVTARGAPFDGVADVGAGSAHTCALRRDGTVHCWGDNSFGQLGDGGAAPSSAIPVAVIGEDGATISDVVQLSVGDFSACIRQRGGRVRCWGRNDSGQLATGDMTHRRVAVPARIACP